MSKIDKKTLVQRYLKSHNLAAVSIQRIDGKIDLSELAVELNEKVKAINVGDMKGVEAMLMSQAHTLDTVFHDLLNRAHLNMGEYMDASIKYFDKAFKAQNQCRMTLGTLGEIKNPRPYIQNNKAQYQQVNNGDIASYTEENLKAPNKQLEDNSDEWLDTRKTQEPIRDDKVMEAVGKEHRTKD